MTGLGSVPGWVTGPGRMSEKQSPVVMATASGMTPGLGGGPWRGRNDKRILSGV